jgi:hypothetical protein
MNQWTTDHYLSLITQFHKRDNFMAMVEALASASVGIGNFIASLPEVFDLDTAIGVQLDATGKWIGKNRFVPYPMNTNWFTFDDTVRGFDEASWKGPYGVDYSLFRLDDAAYRRLLYAGIAENNWDGTSEQAEEILVDYYSGLVFGPHEDVSESILLYLLGPYSDGTAAKDTRFFLESRGDKSSTFAASGKHPPLLILAMMSQPALDLRAAGEKFRSMVVSISESSFFGFDVNNQNVKGFDSGVWGVDPLMVMYANNSGAMDFTDPANSGLIGAVA